MQPFGKTMATLVGCAEIVAMTLLAACARVPATTVCHSTGDASNPYQKITVTTAELVVHQGHPNDIIPAPRGGCPANPVVITDGKMMICHAPGSATDPYDEIAVSVNGLDGHGDHEGDIIPAPEGGCPARPAPASTQAGADQGKVTICHETGSKSNPYVEITISVNGLNGHDKHSGDIIPAPAGGCPTTRP